ncbi:MAG: hypothetical protein AB1546_12470 [bacterium]
MSKKETNILRLLGVTYKDKTGSASPGLNFVGITDELLRELAGASKFTSRQHEIAMRLIILGPLSRPDYVQSIERLFCDKGGHKWFMEEITRKIKASGKFGCGDD